MAPGFALHGLGHHPGDRHADLLGLPKLRLDGIRVAEGHEVDVLEKRLEGDAVLGLAHEGERAVGLAVEPAHAGDEARLAGIEARELHRPFDRVGAVRDEEALLEVAGGQLAQKLGERAAQRIEQLLRGERHALELRLHRPHDLGMVDPRRVDAVAAETVDVAAPGHVLEIAALPAPLDGRELAALGHRLPVLEVALVVVPAEVVEGLGHHLAALVLVELVRVDDAEPALRLLDELLLAHPRPLRRLRCLGGERLLVGGPGHGAAAAAGRCLGGVGLHGNHDGSRHHRLLVSNRADRPRFRVGSSGGCLEQDGYVSPKTWCGASMRRSLGPFRRRF